MHTDSLEPLKTANENGIMSIGHNFDNSNTYPDTYLNSAIWNWENFYTPRITECLQGEFEGKNYWKGINTGIVSLAPLSGNAKDGILEAVDAERDRFRSGTFGMNEMILRESDDNTVLGYAENIKKASRSLLTIINNILDFSKIESGKMDINVQPYRFTDILTNVSNMVKIKAEKKNLKFVISVDENLPNNLIGDDKAP